MVAFETEAAEVALGADSSEVAFDAESAEEFLTAFDGFAQAVRRARGAVPQARPELLTLSQYTLLMPLCESETARVSDLAAEAGIAPSTASRILDALERRSLVRRSRAAHDRRGVSVALTTDGRRTLHEQDRWIRARRLSFFDQLPGAERALVAGLLLRLAGLIDELSAGPEAGLAGSDG